MLYFYGKTVSMENLRRTVAWRNATAKKMKEKAHRFTCISERKQCPICQSCDSTNYVTIHSISYMECQLCGHIYHSQVLDEGDISALYANNSDYLSHMIVDEELFNIRVNMLATPKVDFVTQNIPHTEGQEWLDIGSGGCELLYAARQRGWSVRGIEAGAMGVARANQLGLTVMSAYITPQNAADLLGDPYVISLLDVIEHVPDPLELVNTIADEAKNTNYLVIAVPHHPSLSAFCSALFPEDVVRHLIVPDHIHIFTERSLALLLDKCGFVMTHCWKYGQDFYEVMSTITQQAGKEIDCWPRELYSAINDVQFVLDRHGLSDCMFVIAKRCSNS